MVTILPLQDPRRKSEILSAIPDAQENADVLLMADSSNEEFGWVAVDMLHSTLRMLRVQVNGCGLSQPDMQARFCVDSLMRAAASYGANAGAYRLEALQPELLPLLKPVGFAQTEAGCGTLLSNIVKFL